MIEEYKNLAKRNDLLVTGGSDFHGLVYPDIEMGSGNGDGSIPYSVFDQLVKEVATHGPIQA